MEVALSIAFSLIVIAPFVGRWRANVWIRENETVHQTLPDNVIEIA